jgi:hypothetical protein
MLINNRAIYHLWLGTNINGPEIFTFRLQSASVSAMKKIFFLLRLHFHFFLTIFSFL